VNLKAPIWGYIEEDNSVFSFFLVSKLKQEYFVLYNSCYNDGKVLRPNNKEIKCWYKLNCVIPIALWKVMNVY